VIAHVGATPVFVDIDPKTWNIDPNDVERRITKRTKVIIPIDQLGLPCDIDAINNIARRHDLRVLDDAACAFASRNRDRPVGSMSEVTVFSLHARKVVTTGEGGMIVTNDTALAGRLRRLRHQGMSMSDFARHGMPPTQFESYPEIGYNYRITDLQAAIGLRQLDRLEMLLSRRREVAMRYSNELANHPVIVPPYVPNDVTPNWQSYQVSVRPQAGLERNDIMNRLHVLGIPTRRGVMASHLEEPYRALNASLPNTERAAKVTLQLPIHPGLTAEMQSRVIEAVNEIGT